MTNKDKQFGVYLHWNGGRDSVTAFLEYCKRAGYRDLTSCPDYGFACLAQVIRNFMGADGLSVGIGPLDSLDCDNGDNGLYIVDGWEIVGREFLYGEEQAEHDLDTMLAEIEKAQPYPLPKKEKDK